MKLGWFVVLLFILNLLLACPISDLLRKRPLTIKAGRMLNGEVLKLICGDQRYLIANLAIVNTLFYFGSKLERNPNNIVSTVKYGQMYHNLVQSLKLDPYNQDAYYFVQAVFPWDIGRINEVDRLLDYGMKYRTWDWQLPYWAGFNSAYFLKNYPDAAKYFEKAAQLSGNTLFVKLASRYQHEAGHDELGIMFLNTMIKKTKNDSIKKLYIKRKEALEGVLQVRSAVNVFFERFRMLPTNIDQLVKSNILKKIPDDPYGGVFFINKTGEIRTTSKLVPVKSISHGNPTTISTPVKRSAL